MNVALALICQHNWLALLNPSKNCSPKIIDAFSAHEGEVRLWPTGYQLEELDKICRGCPDRLFEIEERLCPACGSQEFIKEILGPKIENEAKTMVEVYYLECINCHSPLVLKIIK